MKTVVKKKELERNCEVKKRELEGFSITVPIPEGMQRLIKESKIARKNQKDDYKTY